MPAARAPAEEPVAEPAAEEPKEDEEAAKKAEEERIAAEEAEKKRIEEAGGQVVCGRINGILAISRSFGDMEFKYPYNKSMKDFVSPIPALQMTPIGKNNPYLIVTCDGLYEKMDYDELVSLDGGVRMCCRIVLELACHSTADDRKRLCADFF